ncbi:MAG: hypothetical protein ISS16_08210 [Ignavibacteria bacterium]|nr:hypothetical protein [Ignavibacteria bacterium]
MFPTLEVRWFYKDSESDDNYLKVFKNVLQFEEQPARVDHYYYFTSEGSMGIKIREGRLEIKNCFRDYSIVLFNRQVEGKVEFWHKWSFEINQTDSNYQKVLDSNNSWITVKKERTLCKYKITKDEQVSVLSNAEYSENICNVELTNILIRDKKWWSLGFESYGDEGSLFENLILVVREVLSDNRLLSFQADNSFGYPQWIDLFLEV